MVSCTHLDSKTFYRSDSGQITSSKFSAFGLFGEKKNCNPRVIDPHMENEF